MQHDIACGAEDTRTLADPARQCAGGRVASRFGSGRSAGPVGRSFPSPLGPAEELLLLLAERLGPRDGLAAVQKGSFHGDTGQSRKPAGPSSHVPWAFSVSHIREDMTAVDSSLNLTDTTRGTRGKHPSGAFKFGGVSPSSTHLFCLPHTQHLRGMLEEY